MKECKCTFAQKTVGDGCSICNPQFLIEMLQEQIQELEATIEAQEVIIKDIAQPKTCDGCAYISHRYGADCFGCMRLGTSDRYEQKVQP